MHTTAVVVQSSQRLILRAANTDVGSEATRSSSTCEQPTDQSTHQTDKESPTTTLIFACASCQFLDATVSESCRLKDFSVIRKVFETSDVQVKPAVALAGAAGLFAADLAAIRYTNWLQRFPLLFNVGQVSRSKGSRPLGEGKPGVPYFTGILLRGVYTPVLYRHGSYLVKIS